MAIEPADASLLWSEINQDTTDSIILYCGAGVTIDRTGVSWNTLVTEVARQTLRSDDIGANSKFGEECAKFFRTEDFSAEQKATVATAGVNQDVTAKVIADTLYRRSGYRQGRLLDKITQLAVIMAFFGKKIYLVTTNYDTYIEESVRQAVSKFPRTLRPNFEVGIFSLESGDSESEWAEVIRPSANAGSRVADINIFYVHGRIERNGDLSGSLVFSESEYEESHNRTVSLLCALFRQGTTVIVGSSLVDTPLVRSLLQLRREQQESSSDGAVAGFNRYAVMPCITSSGSSFLTLQLMRAGELGLHPIFFEYYDQISDLFSNLISFALKSDLPSGLMPSDFALEKWMDVAKNNFSREISMLAYDYSVTLVREFFNKYFPRDELLKIEFWFLESSETSPTGKALTVWSNSAGPIYTKGLRRTEPVTVDNARRVASVSCFTTGAPNLIGVQSLDIAAFDAFRRDNSKPTRWRSFFSVPISLWFDEFRVQVTIGVITLASMRCVSDYQEETFFDYDSLATRRHPDDEAFLSVQGDDVKRTIRTYLADLGDYVAMTILSAGADENTESE
ncbi:SIR2 family protein [uncultured Actinomyces sp.]|uniref:SIR2 family protein n=1 Tax=uncultured Actinomyces sp. TaxID=249061 RepID=UPI0028E35223|nr:SIR2 family protein [uncultured Actinomyces sp.]